MGRRFAALALVAAPAALAGPAEAATIEFGGGHGTQYVPASVRIHPGDSVTWSGDFGVHPLRSAKASETYGKTGTIGLSESYDHLFASDGVYRFYCAVHGASTADNAVAGMSGQVVVTDNTPPVAAFTQSATQVDSGTRVTFDGSGSHDAEGPVTYEWDLDADGAFDDGTAPTASAVYTSPDGQTTILGVRLRVTDGNADNVGPERSVVRHELTVVGAQSAGESPPGGAPAPGGGPATPGAGTPAADLRPPLVTVLGRRLAVRARRVAVRLRSDEPGLATVTLRAHGAVLARGSGRVATGTRTLRLRLTRAGRRTLTHGGPRLRARLTIVVRDEAGNTRTLRRPVTVRR